MAEEKVLIDNKAVNISETKTVISLKAPSPLWAKWVFRGTFIVTTALSIWVAATGLITPPNKNEILLAFKVIDGLAFGFSKLMGVKIIDEDAKD